MKKEPLPIVAVTMGDPAGVGPEVVVKALLNEKTWEACHPLVVGSRAVMEEAASRFGGGVRIGLVDKPSAAVKISRGIPLLDTGPVPEPGFTPGEMSQPAGRAAYAAIEKAAALAVSGAVEAISTAPVSKEAIEGTGVHFIGHTDALARLAGTPDVAMFLVCGHLRVSHVTAHLSLREACEAITTERVERTIRLTNQSLKEMEIAKPRIGVAALNPHAGEGGLFGREEIEAIAPAVQRTREEGIGVEGPSPPDTIFAWLRAGRYDAVVAMYHDQGHIPIKTLAFHLGPERTLAGVNVTLGLPFVRTSVDHGTAFDIAWEGKADPESMIEAIFLAARLAVGRRAARSSRAKPDATATSA